MECVRRRHASGIRREAFSVSHGIVGTSDYFGRGTDVNITMVAI